MSTFLPIFETICGTERPIATEVQPTYEPTHYLVDHGSAPGQNGPSVDRQLPKHVEYGGPTPEFALVAASCLVWPSAPGGEQLPAQQFGPRPI